MHRAKLQESDKSHRQNYQHENEYVASCVRAHQCRPRNPLPVVPSTKVSAIIQKRVTGSAIMSELILFTKLLLLHPGHPLSLFWANCPNAGGLHPCGRGIGSASSSRSWSSLSIIIIIFTFIFDTYIQMFHNVLDLRRRNPRGLRRRSLTA